MKKIILIVILLFVSVSLFAIAPLYGEWSVSGDEDNVATIVFKTDCTYRFLDDEGNIIQHGTWEMLWGELEFDHRARFTLEWIDDDTFIMSHKKTEGKAILTRQNTE